MAANTAQTLGSLQPTGKRLKWPDPEPGWENIVLELYLSGKKNAIRKYWYQTDVISFWLLCDEYNDYKTATLEPNAAHLREIRAGMDRLGVTFFGRLQANLALTQKKEVAVSDTHVLELADRLQSSGFEPVLDAEVIEDEPDSNSPDSDEED